MKAMIVNWCTTHHQRWQDSADPWCDIRIVVENEGNPVHCRLAQAVIIIIEDGDDGGFVYD